jgi:polysaccharide pyruvyl transferase WcaK-like protein
MALKHSAIVEFGKKLIKYTPLVIWGASIGPFGVNNDVKEYYLNHLKDINKIFCREENTFNYLRNNGISSNLELCSDPAFYVKDIEDYRKFLKGDRLRIALNLSPLSIREQIGEHTTSFQEKVVETIKELITIPNCEIVFVPHVISPLSEKDNDLAYLKNIYEMLPDDYKQNVSILEDAEGFMGTKAFLRTCDIVIAARMHCAVNAVCEGIPTIFLCYSQKGFGMAKYIYGHTDWAIQLTEIDKELSSKLLDILSKRHAISDEIKTRISDIRCDESRIIDLFKKLV